MVINKTMSFFIYGAAFAIYMICAKIIFRGIMQGYESLLSKNGQAMVLLSKELLKYSIGDRLPTVTEFCSSLNMVRGTVQNAMKNLTESGAVRIEARGHLGSYLINKNVSLLLDFAGIKSLVGVMPLPYSRRYEGLATGLIICMENYHNLPIGLAYMRGARRRVEMVLQGRYDFAIVSRFSADNLIRQGSPIETVISFGEESFLSEHVIMFHDRNIHEIQDGMKVGIDESSIDQTELTKMVVGDHKVEYVKVDYLSLVDRIRSGMIDATVMNVDEVIDKKMNINFQKIVYPTKDNTEAVLVVRKSSPEVAVLLKDFLDPATVLNIQKLVMEGRITPSY